MPQIESEYEGRALQVIDRLAKARNGQPLPQAGPWMSELARRAQDRLTMGTVVAETQATLRDIEQRLDRFFRNPLERSDLPATTAMFDQVCGVLSLLGYDEPGRSVAQCSGVDRTTLPMPPSRREPDAFGRIAQNLGAIGFFVESVGQDADRPRGMFRYDPATGIFSADLGQLQRRRHRHRAGRRRFRRAANRRHAFARRRADNVESAALKTLEAAHAQATRLLLVAGDARAIEELERLLPTLANEADLLDNDTLKQNAARASQLLEQLKETHRREDAAELEQLLAPVRAPEAPKPTAPMPVIRGGGRQRVAPDLCRRSARCARQHQRAARDAAYDARRSGDADDGAARVSYAQRLEPHGRLQDGG